MAIQKYRSEKGKTITIYDDGHIFVNGDCTGLKQWKSCSTRYSNLSGTEQEKLRGLDVEKALMFKGILGFSLKKDGHFKMLVFFCIKKCEILFFN